MMKYDDNIRIAKNIHMRHVMASGEAGDAFWKSYGRAANRLMKAEYGDLKPRERTAKFRELLAETDTHEQLMSQITVKELERIEG